MWRHRRWSPAQTFTPTPFLFFPPCHFWGPRPLSNPEEGRAKASTAPPPPPPPGPATPTKGSPSTLPPSTLNLATPVLRRRFLDPGFGGRWSRKIPYLFFYSARRRRRRRAWRWGRRLIRRRPAGGAPPGRGLIRIGPSDLAVPAARVRGARVCLLLGGDLSCAAGGVSSGAARVRLDPSSFLLLICCAGILLGFWAARRLCCASVLVEDD